MATRKKRKRIWMEKDIYGEILLSEAPDGGVVNTHDLCQKTQGFYLRPGRGCWVYITIEKVVGGGKT